MFEGLIELIESIRKGYEDFQDTSCTGQSEMDRQSRRLVRMVCGILIALTLIGAVTWSVFGG
jgi:flagellar biogenesis protein FliO